MQNPDISHRSQSGFTLVEIVVSIGIMGIALLASAAGVSVLLLKQEVSYQATVATSAASLLFSPGTDSQTPSIAQLSQDLIEPLPLNLDQIVFRGGPNLNDTYQKLNTTPGTWVFYRFKDGPALVGGAAIDLRAYQSLVIAIHAPKSSRNPDQSSIDQGVHVRWNAQTSTDNGTTYQNLFDLTELNRIIPHYRFGRTEIYTDPDNPGATQVTVPDTPPLYFGQAVFWHTARSEAKTASDQGTPITLDFTGSYRYLHPAMGPWSQSL
jgi:prepilin-type N-terminal cleavage/methylation domain-containing protein